MYQKIKILCKEKGKSINSLEKELNFGTGTISRWKKAAAGVDKVALVAKSLGTTVDFLLNRQEIPKSRTRKSMKLLESFQKKNWNSLKFI